MNMQSPEVEIRKIFEKSVRLLSKRETQLSTMRQVLKKSVRRLSVSHMSGDVKIDNVLKAMESSVNDIDLDGLDKQLDDLSELVKGSDKQENVSGRTNFNSCLRSSLDAFKCSDNSEDYISMVNELVDEKLPDRETSLQILKIINKISTINKERCQVDENQYIDVFIKQLTDSTDFGYLRNNDDVNHVLNDVALELIKYIYSIKNKEPYELEANQLENDNSNVLSVLIAMVNGLSLPDDASRKQQLSLLKTLNEPENTDTAYNDIVELTINLVNQSVGTLQQKNNDLQAFILKINTHLLEIKSFISQTKLDREETVNRSAVLQESVDTSVGIIQEKIASAKNLKDLKNDISVHLKKIRKQVEENKFAEKEKEEISAQSLAYIISELSSSQNELVETKLQLQQTKSQLLQDSLTGLYNRIAYEERVQLEINRSERTRAPLCLAMWDIDNFKMINDTYGHGIGDRVLKAFAKVITNRIRKTDMFSRIGGEEFVLLMTDTPIDVALSLNNELREIFKSCKFNYNEKEFFVTASIGIAEFLENDSPEAVMKKADTALYQSKNAGRNCCTVFTATCNK